MSGNYAAAFRWRCFAGTALILLAGCNEGLAVNFAAAYSAIPMGATRAEIVAIAKTEPLVTENYAIGGFSVTRLELADLKSRYAFVLAGTPVGEPRLIAKSQVPHVNLK